MKVELFGGAVTLDMGYRTVRTEIVLQGMKQAVPEWQSWGDDSWSYDAFVVCSLVVGTTRAITVNGEADSSEAIAGLRDFWTFVQEHGGEYRAIWEAYQRCISTEIHQLWWNAYVAASRPADLLAPPELQTEATDEGGKKKRSRH